MAVQSNNRRRKEKERTRKYCVRKAGPVEADSAKVTSQQMKCAENDRTYLSREHVKQRRAENMRNTRHSTKTAQQAGPVDVSAKIASHQMKHTEINRTYQSREHVKERRADNQRNTRHSTKKKKLANKKQ
jgi:hypothetical protein